MKERIAEGNIVDAAARVVVYIGKAQHRIEERTFVALRKLLLAHPEVSATEFKAACARAVGDPGSGRARRNKLNADGQRRLGKVLDLLAS